MPAVRVAAAKDQRLLVVVPFGCAMPRTAASMRHEDGSHLDVDTNALANERGDAPLRARRLPLGAVDIRSRIALPACARAVLAVDRVDATRTDEDMIAIAPGEPDTVQHVPALPAQAPPSGEPPQVRRRPPFGFGADTQRSATIALAGDPQYGRHHCRGDEPTATPRARSDGTSGRNNRPLTISAAPTTSRHHILV